MLFQLSIAGAMASTVSGSSARRNSSDLFGEHHAEAPGGAGGILLEQIDPGVRVALFPEIGEIETPGASADDGERTIFLPNGPALYLDRNLQGR
jgi:hypothetical protein